MPDAPSLGHLIRKHRKEMHLSLVQLAESCNISPSFLSQIERDQANPSIPTLYALAETLRVSVADFFSDFISNGSLQDSGTSSNGKVHVVRSSKRKVIVYPEQGIRNEFLSPNLYGAIQMMWIVMPPGTDSGDSPFVHKGEECGVIIQGEVETQIGDKSFLLGPGDSIYHDSTLPHISRNVGDKDAIMIVAKVA